MTDVQGPIQSEAELVKQARRGDEAAWEALIRLHQAPVYRIAYLILADPAAAQDVAQETFIRAYRNLHRFDESRPLRPWLLRISSNQARNTQRSIVRYWRALNRTALEIQTAHDVRVLDENKLGLAEEVWSSIRQLSFDDQRVIYLRYFMELSVAETAKALEIAEGTVKSRLHRALTRLKAILGERDV